MIIAPASRRPRELTVPAILEDERHARRLHDGRRFELDHTPEGVRIFAGWEQVDGYARAGLGEMVAWGEEPLRWRHRRRGDARRRRSDVVIVKVPAPSVRALEEGVWRWCIWLARRGVDCPWSLGGGSMALLRSTLEEPLVTTNGALPAPRWTLGGRQQVWHEAGTVHGPAVLLDLQAAYTHVIGGLRYGGAWRLVERPPRELRELMFMADWPMLAHARVRLPAGLLVGPLARRPRKKPEQGFDELAPNVPYPVAGELRGVFSYPELHEAEQAGARVQVLELYVQAGEGRPFERWHDAVLEGRELEGFAGMLAKAQGNALWGQFVIDDTKGLAVQRWTADRYLRLPVETSKGHQLRAWDIGELVCGSVRARLYELLRTFSPALISCHTDGVWLEDAAGWETPFYGAGGLEQRGWRLKHQAEELHLIDQQKYRWRPQEGKRWRYVVSGVPTSRAPAVFERLWTSLRSDEAAA